MHQAIALAVEAVLARKAQDPVVLDTTGLTPMVDYFLICGGQNVIQVKSIAVNLQAEMEKAGLVLRRKEGGQEGQWILLDFGWLVAHIMLDSVRDFYQLERLWHDAAKIEVPLAAATD